MILEKEEYLVEEMVGFKDMIGRRLLINRKIYIKLKKVWMFICNYGYRVDIWYLYLCCYKKKKNVYCDEFKYCDELKSEMNNI